MFGKLRGQYVFPAILCQHMILCIIVNKKHVMIEKAGKTFRDQIFSINSFLSPQRSMMIYVDGPQGCFAPTRLRPTFSEGDPSFS